MTKLATFASNGDNWDYAQAVKTAEATVGVEMTDLDWFRVFNVAVPTEAGTRDLWTFKNASKRNTANSAQCPTKERQRYHEDHYGKMGIVGKPGSKERIEALRQAVEAGEFGQPE